MKTVCGPKGAVFNAAGSRACSSSLSQSEVDGAARGTPAGLDDSGSGSAVITVKAVVEAEDRVGEGGEARRLRTVRDKSPKASSNSSTSLPGPFPCIHWARYSRSRLKGSTL